MTPSGTNSNAELLKAINALTKAVDTISKTFSSSTSNRSRTGLGGAGSSRAPGSSGNTSQDRKNQKAIDSQYERNKRLYKNQEKNVVHLSAELYAFTSEISKLGKGIIQDRKTYKDMLKMQNENAKTLLQGNNMSRQFQDRFVSQMSTALKSAKSLSGKNLKSDSTSGRIKELIGMQDSMNDVLGKVSGIKAKAGVKSVGDMKEGSIKSIMKSLSDRGLTADGLDSEQFHKQLAGHNSKIEEKKTKAAQALKAGKTERAKMLGYEANILEGKKADFLKQVGGKIDKSVVDIEKFGKSMSTNTIKNMAFSKATDFATNTIKKFGGANISIMSGLTMMGKAFVDYINYVESLAPKGMGGAHLDIALSAFKLGATTDAMVSYYKKMMFQIAQLGFGAIDNIVSTNRESLKKMGLYGDDAIKYAGEFTHSIMGMGIHPKNEKAFNKAFKNYTDQINEMEQLTGASKDELIAHDRAIINSTESQQMLSRLNQTERYQKMESILAERRRITLLIGSNEEATKFIQTMQKLNSQRPEKRIENAMKIQQLAGTMGFGAEAQKLASITMKRPEQLTKDEEKYKNDMMMKMGKRMGEIEGSGSINIEMMMNRFNDIQDESLRSAIQAGRDASLAVDKNGSVDKNSKEAKAAKDAQQIDPNMSTLLDFKKWLESAFVNPLFKYVNGMLLGIGTIAAALIFMKNKGIIADKFKDLKDRFTKGKGEAPASTNGKPGASPKPTTASTVDKAIEGSAASNKPAPPPPPSKEATKAVTKGAEKTADKAAAKTAGKSVGKSLLKKIPLVGLITALGFGAERFLKGDFLGAAGEVASGAAATVPGIGTAASLAIDGALVARDAYKENNVTPIENEKAPVNSNHLNSQSPETINNSKQDDGKKKNTIDDLIQTISSGTTIEQKKLDEMIDLLKILIEAVKPENNGLIEAIKSGKGTGISFNELQSKNSLFSFK